ncbi:hypothetical protein ACGF8B_32300 [Streptomyces sp. NPDC047917]|uniref:hypothetical protein n=1 Tax=Streptomyces sp. NPDC047917 TaxID=3365491 RepID=UPI003721F688
MLLLAGRSDAAAGAVFLLVWGLVAIVFGGAFATKRGAAGIRSLIVNGLERVPRQQAESRAVSEGFVRFVGGFLAICGMVAVPVSVVMLTCG